MTESFEDQEYDAHRPGPYEAASRSSRCHRSKRCASHCEPPENPASGRSIRSGPALELLVGPLHFRALLIRRPAEEDRIERMVDTLLHGLAGPGSARTRPTSR
ncbi:hypothetical protein [Streptomyces sp. NPDC001100]